MHDSIWTHVRVAAGPGSSRIAAPADRSTTSAELAAGGGTARLPAEAGSCAASSLAGAEAQNPSSQSYCVDSRVGRNRHVRCGCVIFSSSFSRAHHKILQKKKRNKQQNRIVHSPRSTTDRRPTNRTTYIYTNDYMFGPVSFRRWPVRYVTELVDLIRMKPVYYGSSIGMSIFFCLGRRTGAIAKNVSRPITGLQIGQ